MKIIEVNILKDGDNERYSFELTMNELNKLFYMKREGWPFNHPDSARGSIKRMKNNNGWRFANMKMSAMKNIKVIRPEPETEATDSYLLDKIEQLEEENDILIARNQKLQEMLVFQTHHRTKPAKKKTKKKKAKRGRSKKNG